MAHLLGYARVSTGEQKLDLQVDELTAAGCWKVWTDQASGPLDRRPQLDAVLAALRPGDTLVVWRLDRLGRSLRHLIETVALLDEQGVGFRSLRESIDTTTAGGRLVFHLFGALAQFEREIIRDRTMAGLASARARGRVGGRPSKLSDEQRRQARKMYDSRELTVEQIGQVLGVSRTSIYRALGATAGSKPPETKVEDAASPALAAARSQGAVVQETVHSQADTEPGAGGHFPAAPPGRVPSTGPRRRAGVGTGADWFVVAVGEGQLPDAPVVVLSRHRSQQAARTAWVKAIRARQPAAPAGEVIEVRAAQHHRREDRVGPRRPPARRPAGPARTRPSHPVRIDGPHDDLVALRRRTIKAKAPRCPPAGRLETVASILLHRAAPFDPQVQAHLAGRWGLPVPAPTEPGGTARTPATPLRAQGAVLRLWRLAAGCPAPSSLTRALELAAATFWTEQGFREALTLMGLPEGTAGAPLVRALSMLWHPGAALPLWPSPTRQGELRGLADRVRHAGVLTGVDVPERLDAADTGWLGEQRLVLRPVGRRRRAGAFTANPRHPRRSEGTAGNEEFFCRSWQGCRSMMSAAAASAPRRPVRRGGGDLCGGRLPRERRRAVRDPLRFLIDSGISRAYIAPLSSAVPGRSFARWHVFHHDMSQ